MNEPVSVERYVLDSYALLAYIEGEPGADTVEAILHASATGTAESWLSIINFGEVLYIVEREQGLPSAHKLVAILDQLPILVALVDRDRTFAAAHIKAHNALSYADAFAIALAKEVDAKVVTGDPEFRKALGDDDLVWIGSDA